MIFRVLRRIIRQKTTPVPRDIAENSKLFLARMYAITAINVVGVALIFAFKNKLELTQLLEGSENLSEPQKWMRTLGTTENHLHYYKMSGLTIVGKEDYEPLLESNVKSTKKM